MTIYHGCRIIEGMHGHGWSLYHRYLFENFTEWQIDYSSLLERCNTLTISLILKRVIVILFTIQKVIVLYSIDSQGCYFGFCLVDKTYQVWVVLWMVEKFSFTTSRNER